MNDLIVIDERVVLGKEFRIYGTTENPMFLARDVAEWIEADLTKVSQILNNVDEEEKQVGVIYRAGQNREMWFLTEEGLYEALMQSKKPIAKEFRKEVKKILKSVRQNGMYATDDLLDDPDLLLKTVTKLTVERRVRIQAEQEKLRLQAVVEEQQPKVAYYDEVLDSTTLKTTTDIAKKLGLRSAQQLNDYLHEKGVIYPVKGKAYDSKKAVWKTVISHWNITAKYSYLVPEYADYDVTRQGQTLKWKEKGRQWIYDWVNNSLKNYRKNK